MENTTDNGRDPEHSSAQEKPAEQAHNEQVGSLAGMGAGMLVGSRVGTVLIPIPVVGTFAGALLGGMLGSEVGRRVGAATLSGVNAFIDSLANPPKRADDDLDLKV